MEAGLWSSDGKTPEAIVSARLYSDIKKHGDQSTFVKVAPQTFFLRDTRLVIVCDAKEPEPRNVNLSDNSKETYSFLDAAEKVLEQFGNRNSMPRALKRALLIPSCEVATPIPMRPFAGHC